MFDADVIDPDGAGPDTPTACIEVGNDEDGDAIDDGCDPCPHLFGTNRDADGDGVGDDCDPSPETAQRIVRFETFMGPLAADWTPTSGTTSIENGRLVLSPNVGGASIRRPWSPGRSTFAIQFEVATPAAPDVLLGLFLGDVPNNSLGYCEFFGQTPTRLQLTHQINGGAFINDASTIYPVVLASTQGMMTFRVAPGEFSCVGALSNQPALRIAAPFPAGIVPTVQTLYVQHVETRVDWLIEIRDSE